MVHIQPCKVSIAGDGGCGKTTLLATKNTGHFQGNSNLTIGVDFACMELSQKDISIPVLIYDLGGQPRFQFLHDTYILGTKAGIILYDLTRSKTFDHVPKWLSLLFNENPQMPIILVGSKRDLVQPEDLIQFRKRWNQIESQIEGGNNVVDHVFISSQSFEGINVLFERLTQELIPLYEINVSA